MDLDAVWGGPGISAGIAIVGPYSFINVDSNVINIEEFDIRVIGQSDVVHIFSVEFGFQSEVFFLARNDDVLWVALSQGACIGGAVEDEFRVALAKTIVALSCEGNIAEGIWA